MKKLLRKIFGTTRKVELAAARERMEKACNENIHASTLFVQQAAKKTKRVSFPAIKVAE